MRLPVVDNFEHIDVNKGLRDAIEELEPTKPGWNCNAEESEVAVGFLRMKSGRLAEVRIRLVADEDEFMCEPEGD